MFKFLARRPLWFNILFAIAIVVVLLLLFMLSLQWLTKHGKSLTVPAVTSMNVKDAQKLLDKKGFDVIIQDSVYYDSLPPGMVLKQIPDADAVVKVNRTVFITINRFVPPDVQMPDLKGYSYRNAEMVLTNLGLKIRDTSYKADFAKNSVLEQLYNGQPIAPGTKLKMGSKISLVLGSGIGNEYVAVPDLIGKTYEEAIAILDADGLVKGAVILNPDVKDTSAAFIYWQRPAPRSEDGKRLSMRPGQTIDMRVQLQKPVTTDSSHNSIPPPPNQ